MWTWHNLQWHLTTLHHRRPCRLIHLALFHHSPTVSMSRLCKEFNTRMNAGRQSSQHSKHPLPNTSSNSWFICSNGLTPWLEETITTSQDQHPCHGLYGQLISISSTTGSSFDLLINTACTKSSAIPFFRGISPTHSEFLTAFVRLGFDLPISALFRFGNRTLDE